MTNGEAYPESLQKLLAANDELHHVFGEVLEDKGFGVYNRCAAAEHMRKAFALIDTAKSILGWQQEPPTPPPEEPPAEPVEPPAGVP